MASPFGAGEVDGPASGSTADITSVPESLARFGIALWYGVGIKCTIGCA